MKITDKSIYIPDIKTKYPEKKICKVFDKTQDDKIDNASWTAENFNIARGVVVSFLNQQPSAFTLSQVEYHLNRCYQYAMKNDYNVKDCFHYSGMIKEEEVTRKLGIRITNIFPSEELYQIMILEQGYYFGKKEATSQRDIEVIYHFSENRLFLQDSKFTDIENGIIEYIPNPIMVKALRTGSIG